MPPHLEKNSKSLPEVSMSIRVYGTAAGLYDEEFVYKVLEEVQRMLTDMCDESPILLNSDTYIKDWTGESHPDQGFIYLSFNYMLDIPQNPIAKPVKPTKPTRPTPPKSADADYIVRRKAYYDPAEDIEDLFYNIGGNTIPNIEQKLRQAGWITGYDIYIPKDTQLKNGPDRRVVDYWYETLQVVGGTLDGVLIPFMRDDDELCANTFIRKYCKHI